VLVLVSLQSDAQRVFRIHGPQVTVLLIVVGRHWATPDHPTLRACSGMLGSAKCGVLVTYPGKAYTAELNVPWDSKDTHHQHQVGTCGVAIIVLSTLHLQTLCDVSDRLLHMYVSQIC